MDYQQDIGQLLEQAKAGDHEAFQQLHELARSQNYYVILKIVKNVQDAEDLLQDTWLKIYQNLGQIHDTRLGSFLSWSGKVASNTALDFLRKKRPVLFSDLQNEEGSEQVSFDIQDFAIENQPELAFDQKETSEIIQELLSGLADEQRICVIMFYLQEMSIREIAESMGCSENTIKSRLVYARKKIQAQGEVLEKKGIHLRGVAPLFLLGCLLRNEMADAMESSSRVELGPDFWRRAVSEGSSKTAGGAGENLAESKLTESKRKESKLTESKRKEIGGKNIAAAGRTKLLTILVSGAVGIAGIFGGYSWVQSRQEVPHHTEQKAPGDGEAESSTEPNTPEPTEPAVLEPTEPNAPEPTEQAVPEPTEPAVPEPTEQQMATPTKKPKSGRTEKPKKKATPKPAVEATKKPAAKPTKKPSVKPKKNPANELELDDDPNDLDSGW